MRVHPGAYTAQVWSDEIAVLPGDDGLVLPVLPTDDPMKNLAKLKKTGEHAFRRLRKDETLGEEVVFEMDADGNVERFKRHGKIHLRLKP